MEKFFVYLSTSGRLDTSLVRAWMSEEQIVDLLTKYSTVAVFRTMTNQVAILLPESDRIVWADIQNKEYSSLLEELNAYTNSMTKRVHNA